MSFIGGSCDAPHEPTNTDMPARAAPFCPLKRRSKSAIQSECNGSQSAMLTTPTHLSDANARTPAHAERERRDREKERRGRGSGMNRAY